MGRQGRPQGDLKGVSEQADRLAVFLRELTRGLTVRDLARLYPASKTSWSEYRSGAKTVPLILLERLIDHHVRAGDAHRDSLAEARHLHRQAEAAHGLRQHEPTSAIGDARPAEASRSAPADVHPAPQSSFRFEAAPYGIRQPALAVAAFNAPLVEVQIHAAAQRSMRFSALGFSDDHSSRTVEALHAEVVRVSRAYTTVPLPGLIEDLADLQDFAFSLTQRRYAPDQSRELYFLAGVVSGLMVKASLDMGNPYAARAQATTALLCAERAGHIDLQAKILSWQSLAAYWAGWSRQALAYAQQGAGLATGGRVSVFLPAVAARAHAAMGDRAAALAALADAERASRAHRRTDLDDLGGLFDFPPCRRAYFRAETLVLLDPARPDSVRAADAAVVAMAEASPVDRYFANEASASAHQAVTRIAVGDFDGATESLTPVLGLPEDCRNQDVIVSIMRVHRQLDRADRPLAGRGEMQEQIERFVRTGPRPRAPY
ncbi:hypothetical protein ACH4U6_01555 [Streptomyces netropsis]|uniref:hypothetical protein n=1 Tax=Streptomyces netropsis TaxID=55404 RepID=UPI0037AFFAEB